MEEELVKVFVGEVEKQCMFALMSVNRMNSFLTSYEKGDINDFWLSVQSFLISTANVSKLLWNTHKSVPEESKELRNILEVEDDSVLRSRRFRNLFEHYDEQIVDWFNSSEQRNYASSNVFPRGALPLNPKDMFRNFYNDENVLTFRGEEYKIQPVVDELSRVYNLSREIVYK